MQLTTVLSDLCDSFPANWILFSSFLFFYWLDRLAHIGRIFISDHLGGCPFSTWNSPPICMYKIYSSFFCGYYCQSVENKFYFIFLLLDACFFSLLVWVNWPKLLDSGFCARIDLGSLSCCSRRVIFAVFQLAPSTLQFFRLQGTINKSPPWWFRLENALKKYYNGMPFKSIT